MSLYVFLQHCAVTVLTSQVMGRHAVEATCSLPASAYILLLSIFFNDHATLYVEFSDPFFQIQCCSIKMAAPSVSSSLQPST